MQEQAVEMAGLSVGAVSRLAGVSVRTLHHYDAIGLLSPSMRSASGYRLYATSDLVRLQRILCYRSLGFELATITAIVNDPDIDELEHLRTQRELLTAEMDRLHRMVVSVEKMMEARKMGINLDPKEMFEVFGDDDPTKHGAEAEERWGNTDAFKESKRRTSKYGKEDWLRIKDEAAEINVHFTAAMKKGLSPDCAEVMALAERHRLHISKWFYECSHDFHRGLGDMYVSDPRFTANIEKEAPGLAAYMRDAIHANASRSAA